MLVKRSLPFDSTFDSFRDAVESYQFGLEEIRAQIKPRPKLFKRNAHSAQSSSRPTANLGNQRSQILFMRRLENDGAKISISS